MACYSGIADNQWAAARVRMLYTEPYRSRLDAAISELKRSGAALPEVMEWWQIDVADIRHRPLRKDEECDWLIGTARYQAGYADNNLAAVLLCDSLWRILESGGEVPEECQSWWSGHLFKDGVEAGQTRPDKALLAANILEIYVRERELFRAYWIDSKA